MSVESLKSIAMLTMLCDHLGYVGILGEVSIWLRVIGRIAFPIYAYLIASNFIKTKNKLKYVRALFLFALISEIPFNLMQGTLVNTSNCNVLWTFFIASCVLVALDKQDNRLSCIALLMGLATADFINSDYSKWGIFFIIMVFFTETKLDINSLKSSIREEEVGVIEPSWAINLDYTEKAIAGICGVFFALLSFCRFTSSGKIAILGFSISVQMFGLLSIIPIGVYLLSGQVKILEGERDKMFRKICYWFYPLHMIVLGIFFS